MGRCENPEMNTPPEWAGPDGYVVSSDPGRLDVERIHRFLTAAYWSRASPATWSAFDREFAALRPVFALWSASGVRTGGE